MRAPAPAFRLANDLIELGLASGLVIWLRSARLAQAPLPFDGRDRQEAERMVLEKLEAVVESNLAVMRFGLRAQSAALATLFGARPESGLEIAERTADDLTRLLTAGLRPYRRRARANARRLIG